MGGLVDSAAMWVGWELQRCMGLMGSLRSYGAFGRARESFQTLKGSQIGHLV